MEIAFSEIKALEKGNFLDIFQADNKKAAMFKRPRTSSMQTSLTEGMEMTVATSFLCDDSDTG